MDNRTHEITQTTNGPGLYDITRPAHDFVKEVSLSDGLLTVFCRHTSASLIIQENADPDVQSDLKAFFDRLVPHGSEHFQHTTEGPDDMPAHVKAALTASSVSVPIMNGKLALGTWQAIYLFEHRRAPHQRRIVLHVIGA